MKELYMIVRIVNILAEFKDGYGDIFAAMYMALIFTVFSWISSKYLKKTNEAVLRKFFGVFTIIAGFYIFFNKS